MGKRFDVIGFDPRGVGASTPRADCYTDAEYDRGEGFQSTPLPAIADEQQVREAAQRCADGSGGPQALVNLGTHDTARDLDVLRAALGDEQLSYVAYSYWTEPGAVYAEAFPQNVRAIVLGGAVDPALTAAEFRLSQYAGFQEAFMGLATACAANGDCPLGTDRTKATEAFQAIVRPLLDRPVPTADGRGLTYGDALNGVMAGLYSKAQWPTITQGLAEVAAGRGDVLLGLRDNFLLRGADGPCGTDMDVNTAIRCMDDPRRDPVEQTELAQQIYAAAPFLDSGRPVTELHRECEAWPQPPTRPEPWVTGDVDVAPTLTVSITGDPATPYQGGVNLARILNGSLLTVEGAQHGIALVGQSECVDRIVTDYMIDPQAPLVDARCTA